MRWKRRHSRLDVALMDAGVNDPFRPPFAIPRKKADKYSSDAETYSTWSAEPYVSHHRPSIRIRHFACRIRCTLSNFISK